MPNAVPAKWQQTVAVNDALNKYWGGGQILWVGNRTGLPPQGDGSNPTYPLNSIGGAGGALAKLQASTSRGHVIFVLPGHAESVSSADYFSAGGAADSFTIIGLGRGNSRPTLTWTTATSTWLFDTANVTIDNCRLFLAGAHAAGTALTVAAPITVSAAGCGIVNCEIWWGFDADQIVTIGINLGTAADGFKFNGNRCYAETAAVPTTTFLRLNGADQLEIVGTHIIGPGSTTAIGPVQQLTTGCLKAFISCSTFQNTLASSTIAFTAIAGCTGTVDDCSFGVLASGNGITTGSGLQVTGSYTAIAGAAGVATTG
jgi:hypothetical protein